MIGCVAAMAVASSVSAREIGFVLTSPVKDKAEVRIEQWQAYILLRTDSAMPLHLIKLPSALDRSAYDRMRADALAEARQRYWRRMAAGRGNDAIEPTEENFEFVPLAVLSGVSIGPSNRFSSRDGVVAYLQAVTPGSYRIYGPVSANADGRASGTCLCMGSVAFEARAGEVTDMGTITVQSDTGKKTAPAGDGIAPFSFRIRPATADMPVDPRLKGATVKPASYRPVGKLPNYFGLTIDRLDEMPGIFRYDRDRIVDLTAVEPAR